MSASDMTNRLRVIEDTTRNLLELIGGRFDYYDSDVLALLGDQIARVMIAKGANDRNLWGISSWVRPGGRVVGEIPPSEPAAPSIAVTGGGSLNFVKMAVLFLAEAASNARAEVGAVVRPGRGGARREGRTRSSALALDLIALYRCMRQRYPSSGRPPRYSSGGPLPRFVFAVFDALAERDPDLKRIPETSIGSLFYQLEKSKGATD